MKFLTSSSSSASSTITTTTATSFDCNVHNSKSATAGCIAGVFRRLLCLNSLPTYPSDHFKEAEIQSLDLDNLQCIKTEGEVEASAAPGIVARLMGLDSLPQIDFKNAEKSPNSICRSRSMNSVDSLKEIQSIQGRHRRAKSFRETPTFLELEDEEFLILSFENGNESMQLGVKGSKSEMGCGQMKQTKAAECKIKNKRRESVYAKNKENQQANNVSNEKLENVMNSPKVSQRASCGGRLKDSGNILCPTTNSYQNSHAAREVVKLAKPRIHQPERETGKRRIKMIKNDCLPVKKIEIESDSENSSPNSVLDMMDFPCNLEDARSDELSRLTNSKSRRTLTEELEKYRKLNLHNGKTLIRSKSTEGKRVQHLRKSDQNNHRYVQTWGEICTLAEKETVQSNWIHKNIHELEAYKEVGAEFQLEILDELLGELVDQLLENFHQNF